MCVCSETICWSCLSPHHPQNTLSEPGNFCLHSRARAGSQKEHTADCPEYRCYEYAWLIFWIQLHCIMQDQALLLPLAQRENGSGGKQHARAFCSQAFEFHKCLVHASYFPTLAVKAKFLINPNWCLCLGVKATLIVGYQADHFHLAHFRIIIRCSHLKRLCIQLKNCLNVT